jgi:hypothetical protein
MAKQLNATVAQVIALAQLILTVIVLDEENNTFGIKVEDTKGNVLVPADKYEVKGRARALAWAQGTALLNRGTKKITADKLVICGSDKCSQTLEGREGREPYGPVIVAGGVDVARNGGKKHKYVKLADAVMAAGGTISGAMAKAACTVAVEGVTVL